MERVYINYGAKKVPARENRLVVLTVLSVSAYTVPRVLRDEVVVSVTRLS